MSAMFVGDADEGDIATFLVFANARLLGHEILPSKRQLEVLQRETKTFCRYVNGRMNELEEMLVSHRDVGEDLYCVEEIFDCGWVPLIHDMWLISAFEHWEIWLGNQRSDYLQSRGELPEHILLDSIFGKDQIHSPVETLEARWKGLLDTFGPVGVVLNYIENSMRSLRLNCDHDVIENAEFWNQLTLAIQTDSHKCIRYV